jgi:hypothetical protein
VKRMGILISVGIICFVVGGCSGATIMALLIVGSKSDKEMVGDDQHGTHAG